MKPFDAYFKKMMLHYAWGFLGALLLTLLTFALAYTHAVNGWIGAGLLVVFALVQAGVQAYFFLHLGEEKKPRWRNYSFFFTVAMIVVVVVGLLWVMINLNYNMNMAPDAMQHYMLKQVNEGF